MPSWMGPPYAKNMPRKPRALHCMCLFLGMWMAQCSGAENNTITASLLNDVSSVIENKTVLPFCYTTDLFDLTCFWESGRSDASNYTFQYELDGKTETCTLRTVTAANGTWWHVCKFPGDKVGLFALSPHQITVTDNWENSSFSRNCKIEKVVYLKPIENITVIQQFRPKGLVITFKEIEYNQYFMLANSLMYEVKYTRDESNVQKSETFHEVEAQQGYVKLFLHGVIEGAEYTLSVRAKANNYFDGYWSPESDVIRIKTSYDFLFILLYVICGLILIAAIILTTMYRRRLIKKKVWPKIPSPEHHFKETYTTHKGNFKLWLDQTDSYLMWISSSIFHEGPISTLEVLSELPMPPPIPTTQPPPKDSYVTLDKTFLPQFPAWMVTQRQIGAQMELLSPTETSDQEKTSRGESRAEEDLVEMTAVEVPPVGESERYPTKEKPSSLPMQREDSLNSEESKQSPGSSFEYTALDTYGGLLTPRTRSIPPRQPLKYAYLLMSESGEESPPPSPNIYQNSICAQLPTNIYSQC